MAKWDVIYLAAATVHRQWLATLHRQWLDTACGGPAVAVEIPRFFNLPMQLRRIGRHRR